MFSRAIHYITHISIKIYIRARARLDAAGTYDDEFDEAPPGGRAGCRGMEDAGLRGDPNPGGVAVASYAYI